MPVTRQRSRVDHPLIAALREAAPDAAETGAHLIAAEAARLCPRGETGDLAAGIHVAPPRKTRSGAVARVIADGQHQGAEETHAAFVEFGHATPQRRHRKRAATTPPPIEPRPFMRPAAANARLAAQAAVIVGLLEGIAAASK